MTGIKVSGFLLIDTDNTDFKGYTQMAILFIIGSQFGNGELALAFRT
jgi:hypothetical protein